MRGWTWEYVEETVTAERLDAINRMAMAGQPQKPKRQITLEEFRAQHPNGISDGG